MPEVTIYTTPTCTYCQAAKAFFQEHDIEYTDIDVSSDPEAAQEMIRKSGQSGVPVIEVDGEIIVGFDKPRLMAALGLD